jgi:hypothetical protein
MRSDGEGFVTQVVYPRPPRSLDCSRGQSSPTEGEQRIHRGIESEEQIGPIRTRAAQSILVVPKRARSATAPRKGKGDSAVYRKVVSRRQLRRSRLRPSSPNRLSRSTGRVERNRLLPGRCDFGDERAFSHRARALACSYAFLTYEWSGPEGTLQARLAGESPAAHSQDVIGGSPKRGQHRLFPRTLAWRSWAGRTRQKRTGADRRL